MKAKSRHNNRQIQKGQAIEIADKTKSVGLHLRNAYRRDPFFGGDLSDSKIYSVPTIGDIKQRFGVPQTLGMSKDAKMAFDSQIEVAGGFNLLQHGFEMGMFGATASFLGYSALQSIAQNGLIRACIETTADDMTRNWIELKRQAENPDGEVQESEGRFEEDEDIIERLKKEMVRLDLQRVMHDAVAMTGYYGGCLIYLDTGITGDGLVTPLYMDPVYSSEANKRGFLRRLQVIDPINISPGSCNFNNPLAPDYYKPKTWLILGQEVHASRLIRIVANEAPLVFRPAYNFLGIPQAQLLWDYVLHFQKNRDSVNRLLNKFSSTVLKTAMSDILQGSADDDNQLDARVQMYVRERSNDGVLVIDKEMEDIVKLETPLGGLTDIVRQSLEILAAMNRTPAVKLLGISPSGFNATGESDLRNYYDYILSQQEKQMRGALNTILQTMQLSLTGNIDQSITFDFCSLSDEDENVKVSTQKQKVDTYMQLINGGVISPEEVRQMLIADPDSGMNDLDPDDMPEPPMDEAEGLMGGMGRQPEVDEEQQKSDAVRQELFGTPDGGSESKNPFEGATDEWVENPAGWFSTEDGVHIPLKEGQSKEEALNTFFEKSGKSELKNISSYKPLSVSETLSAAKHPKSLSQAQKDAIVNYTGDPDINNSLRDNDVSHPYTKKQIELLDSVFKDAKTTAPITVFRGVGEAMGMAPWVKDIKSGKLKKGDIIHDEGFLSTSADTTTPKEAIEDNSMPVLLKINVPKGSKAISINDYSSFPEQKEILLNRNNNLRIQDISKMEDNGFLVEAVLE